MATSLKRASSRLALGLGALLLPLLALEIGARQWFDPRPGDDLRRMTPNETNCLARSELLGMELAPRCAGVTFTETIRTNELGLRDSPIREDGARRILAIGDSCTYGWGLAQEDAYPQVLQSLLDRQFGAERFRVINAGVPGFTSHHGLLYLRERGLALHPEIVIFGFGFNDFWRAGNIEAALESNRRFLPLIRFDDFLVRNSSFWRWLRVHNRRVFGREQPQRMSLEDYQRNITGIVEQAKAHGAHVLMIVFAVQNPAWEPHARDALALAATLGIPVIRYDRATSDRVHPTKEGNAALAVEIQERLAAEGYLGDATARDPRITSGNPDRGASAGSRRPAPASGRL